MCAKPPETPMSFDENPDSGPDHNTVYPRLPEEAERAPEVPCGWQSGHCNDARRAAIGWTELTDLR